MKRLNFKCIIAACFVFSVVALLYACNKQLDKQPLGSLALANVSTEQGVNGLLIGAYKLLSGENVPAPGFAYGSAASNWVYGSIAADDSYKGSTPTDQPDATQVESWSLSQSTTNYLDEKWTVLYNGIQRANDVLRILPLAKDISAANATAIKAEARFLRGHYHFEGKKVWNNFPYVDESVSFQNDNLNVANDKDIWPLINADFKFAVDNLPAIQPNIGRVNKWAAMAFLAKAYMFQHKYDSAKTLLDQLITNGTTAGGLKYDLVNYESNFNAPQKNGPESVFAVQMSVNDGSSTQNDGGNGNMGDVLNYPNGPGAPGGCCGFNNPSWNLANVYKTNANGLPLLDSWNDGNVVSDSTNLYTGTLDPRIDWNMGRPGIPYLDYGPHSANWIRDPTSNGKFSPKKNVYAKSQAGVYSSTATVFWGATQITSNNYNLIRFADILLWAAECEAEIGSLDQAQAYVNRIRSRAANPTGWVYKNSDYDANKGQYKNQITPADNYLVSTYPVGAFASNGKDYVRKAIRFERRLELAMEGHRFFDLQRWDNGTGEMANILNNYVSVEKTRRSFYYIVNTAVFTKGVNEYFAIPQVEIDAENASGKIYLKQNKGYN
ncbi:MAG: RagB/SusD family nutrient uptake outer membrane protein [Chitinophagaceae bacterium]